MKLLVALWERGFIPCRVLPIRWIDNDPFWKLAYHIEMWKAFGGSFCYLEAK